MINQKTVKELFRYDPDTGILAWRISRSNRVKAGQEAGCVILRKHSGKAYRVVNIKGPSPLGAHIVIWAWVTGHYPKGSEQIDHIDGNGLNNRWSNLRLVSGQLEQSRNQRLRSTNTTGAVGVSFVKRDGKYKAYVTVKGRTRSLGYFRHLEDAVAARRAASVELGFHKNHGQERPL